MADHTTMYRIVGASNHFEEEREVNDYYATEPKAIDLLLSVESIHNNVWECATGENHLAKRLEEKGFNVKKSDIIQRKPDIEIIDFLSYTDKIHDYDILTNPPFKYAEEFVRNALNIVDDGRKVFMFLKLTFLESQSRKVLFEQYPPKFVYVFSKRIKCVKNGDFSKNSTPLNAYAWFVWEKGFHGDSIVRWL